MMGFLCKLWLKIKPELNQSFISIIIAFASLILTVYGIKSSIESGEFQNQFNDNLLGKLDTLTGTTKNLTETFASSMSSYVQLKQYDITSKTDKIGNREISPVLTISNIGKSEAINIKITVSYYFDCFKNKSFIYEFDTIPYVKVNTYFANHRWEQTSVKIPVNHEKIISKILIQWYDTRLKKNDSIVEYERFKIFEDDKIFAIGMTKEQNSKAEKIFNLNKNSVIYHGRFERYY